MQLEMKSTSTFKNTSYISTFLDYFNMTYNSYLYAYGFPLMVFISLIIVAMFIVYNNV